MFKFYIYCTGVYPEKKRKIVKYIRTVIMRECSYIPSQVTPIFNKDRGLILSVY